MLQAFLSTTRLTIWPLIGLVIFFVTFCVVVIRVFSKRHRAEYERMARLPLDDSHGGSQPTRGIR
jgi:cbb3-type cytochrome oxidase subunit 3